MIHVVAWRHCVGGKRRPRRKISGVARAQTSQEAKTVKNRRDQRCCMPTARMPATICVAFTRAKATQRSAIQRQGCRGAGDGRKSMPDSIALMVAIWAGNAAKSRAGAGEGMAGGAALGRYYAA